MASKIFRVMQTCRSPSLLWKTIRASEKEILKRLLILIFNRHYTTRSRIKKYWNNGCRQNTKNLEERVPLCPPRGPDPGPRFLKGLTVCAPAQRTRSQNACPFRGSKLLSIHCCQGTYQDKPPFQKATNNFTTHGQPK
jgi:hypothetical protein